MVVSEMGEQWSPHTAPAMQAEMQMMPRGLSSGEHVLHNGDQDAEGAPAGAGGKGQAAADEEDDGGQQQSAGSPAAELCTKSRTKYLAPRESVMAFRDQAKVRIRMAGTMALKPSGMQAIISLKDMDRRTEIVDQGEHQAEGRTQHQAHGGVASWRRQ